MIHPKLSQRNLAGENVSFTIYDIILKNFSGNACGIVSYVRMGEPNEDVLNMAIMKAIQTRYPGSILHQHSHYTSQNVGSFPKYGDFDRLYISARNTTKFDPAHIMESVDSDLSIHMDVYNANENYVFKELEVYLNETLEDISNACNEEYSNFATYRDFIQ